MSQLTQWLNPRSSAAKMAVLFTVVSVAFYAAARFTAFGALLPLVPDRVISEFALWRLITYAPLFSPQPFSFIFGVLILVSVGGALERHWGAKHLWLFALGIAIGSAVVTVVLSLFIRYLGSIPFLGADMIVSSMWVGYGLMVGPGRTNFWGLPVTGNTLALIGAAYVLLGGLLGNFTALVPDITALVLTFVHVRYGFPGDVWTRLQSWRLQRDLQKRSSHLKVISGDDRNTPRGSDKYLH
jgi:membrane associated rhomboid family serine protease